MRSSFPHCGGTHVAALEAVNVLVNYWYNDVARWRASSRRFIRHALSAIRDLPVTQRDGVGGFGSIHFVFGPGAANAADHLPPDASGRERSREPPPDGSDPPVPFAHARLASLAPPTDRAV